MRKNLIFFIWLTIISYGFKSLAQQRYTPPTMEDQFGKKSGNLRLSSFKMDFGRIKNNEIRNDSIFIYNTGRSPMNLSLPLKVPLYLKVTIRNNPILPGTQGYIAVSYDASKRNDYGFVLDRIQINSDDALVPQKYITLTAYIEEFFPVSVMEDSSRSTARVPELTYSYGQIKQGEKVSHVFKIYNDGKKVLQLHKIKNDNASVKASFSKKEIMYGDSAIVSVEFDSAGKLGKDSRKFSLFVGDPMMPEVRFEMNGVVIK